MQPTEDTDLDVSDLTPDEKLDLIEELESELDSDSTGKDQGDSDDE